jgi:hypothetical protein
LLKKFSYLLIFTGIILLSACSQTPIPLQPNKSVFQMVANQGSYESYWDKNDADEFILNLAFNHSPNVKVDAQYISSIELLPNTDLTKVKKFVIDENPPQKNLQQKALMITLVTQKPGKHTFTKIVFHTKEGKKVLDLGKLEVNVHKGIFSGIMTLTGGQGVFPGPTPLLISPRNDNDYPTTIKGVILNHPYIRFNAKDVKMIVNEKERNLPENGYTLKPNEKLIMKVDWKVVFPQKQIINMEARPLIVSEHEGKLEYADVPNMIYRNDFK